jgi:hypothetical protein
VLCRGLACRCPFRRRRKKDSGDVTQNVTPNANSGQISDKMEKEKPLQVVARHRVLSHVVAVSQSQNGIKLTFPSHTISVN